MAQSIATVAARERLAVRKEPHWQKVRTGAYIGYRKTGPDSGTWVARIRTSEGQKYKALGDLREAGGAKMYDHALKLAQAWFDHADKGGSFNRHMVKDGMMAYIDALREAKGEAAAVDAMGRIERLVLADKAFACLAIESLTERDVQKWRKSLGGMAPSTINRNLNTIRAAFNLALHNRWATSAHAWERVLGAVEAPKSRREYCPTPQEIEAVIERLEPHAAAFVRLLSLLPLRPGAVAGLRVKDWHRGTSELIIPVDKSGAGRRISLPTATAQWLTNQCAGRIGEAPICPRPDGKPWCKDSWKTPIKSAALAAGVGLVAKQAQVVEYRTTKEKQAIRQAPHDTQFTAYSLRHAGITTMVLAGVPVFTVATISGTSVAMIEKHYGHLTASAGATALEHLSKGVA